MCSEVKIVCKSLKNCVFISLDILFMLCSNVMYRFKGAQFGASCYEDTISGIL